MNGKTTITIDHGAAPGADAAHSEQRPRHASALDLVASTPWAIEPAMLDTIRAIALREGEGIEAVEARQGRPLQNARSVTMREGVAVVPITGPVFRYANLFTQISGATSLEILAKDFTAALDDPAVHAIVLDINSPGGQAAGIGDFAQHVRAAGKPVVAFIDGMAASAAYWIAAAAPQVVISKSGMAGNVGAVLGLDVRKDPNKTEIVSSQSPNKRPDVSTDAGRAQMQRMVDALAQVFIDDVAAFRGMTPAAVIKDFNGGDMFTGAAAVAAGMADSTGTLEDVIASLQKNAAPGAARPQSPIGASRMKTIDELRAAHPDLCAELVRAEIAALTAESLLAGNAPVHAAAVAQGATSERERILAVMAQGQHLPGHADLIAALVADGKTTAPEAAVQILAAEGKKLGAHAERLKKEAPAPVANAPAPDDAAALAAEAGLPVEERCKAAWERDPKVRAEFGSIEAYIAFERAHAAGKVRVLGAKK